MDYYREFVYLRTYSRWMEDKGRRETWPETVKRYMDYMKKRLGNKLSSKEYSEVHEAIINMDVLPSMRLLWTAGEVAEKCHASAYNCSFVTPTKIKRFGEILYLLTNGCGVGFSVEEKYVKQLPEVEMQTGRVIETFVVPDTREGWADALVHGMRTWFDGEDVRYDYSKIRPLGARLKTMGGRASGKDPLRLLLDHTRKIILSRQGVKLRPVDVHDIITKIGEVVVAGGTRRSAQISLSDLNDEQMRGAKTGAFWEHSPHRAMANNSAVYNEKPDSKTFMKEWAALVSSGTGERGIFNRGIRIPDRRKELLGERINDLGTNPCLHPDTIIETVNGRVKIKDITRPTMVYTMGDDRKLTVKKCSPSWISKRNADTLTITISSGKKLRCTPDHKIYVEGRGWVRAEDIHINDRVVHLVRNRRGACYSGVKLTTQDKRDQIMEHRLVWEAVNGKIPEGYDIHHIDGDTNNNDIENLECLSHSEHARLTACEQPNNHQSLGFRKDSPGRHGSFWGFVSGPDSTRGEKQIVPMPETLKSNLHQYANVISIEGGEQTDVYDISVEDTHNLIADFIIVHNCSEINLIPQQFCNLSEVVARSGDTKQSLLNKVRIAAIIGTYQSSLTDFKYLSSEWKKNCDEEALLGVSITGQCDCPEVMKPKTLEALKDEAIRINVKYSKKIGVNPSTSVTTVKPSGTVSQLVNASSGIHPRYSPYYIRRIRISGSDPLFRLLKDAGVPYFPESRQTPEMAHTWVLEFPNKAPEGSITTQDIDAIKQLERWKVVKLNYTEHNPSCSIYVKDDEWMKVGAWVFENWGIVGGLSFFPIDDHVYPLAPYEKITKEQYEKMNAEFPTIDYSRLSEYEKEDNTVSPRSCEGSTCVIE